MAHRLLQHHATGIVGEGTDIISQLSEVVPIKGNPDFFHEKFETLAIEDSRRIRELHESKPFSADIPRVFVIEIHGATREAQNALLKTLEEPRPNNFFFIIVPSMDILLPTVKSRLHIMGGDGSEVSGATSASTSVIVPETKKFLGMSLSEKIAYVDDLAARISDDKAQKYEAVAFLNSLERALYAARPKKNFSDHDRIIFGAIDRARNYLNDRAPSVKMLLEYVVLTM